MGVYTITVSFCLFLSLCLQLMNFKLLNMTETSYLLNQKVKVVAMLVVKVKVGARIVIKVKVRLNLPELHDSNLMKIVFHNFFTSFSQVK